MPEAPLKLRARTTVKLRVYLLLAAAGMLGGLVLARPALVALAAPFAVYLAIGVRTGLAGSSVQVTVESRRSLGRVREGGMVEVEVAVTASHDIAWAEFALYPGPGLRAASGPRSQAVHVGVRLRAGRPRVLRFPVRAERWGAPRAGVLRARLRDRMGAIGLESRPHELPRLAVMPQVETLRELIEPTRLRATVGSRVARGRGEGIEFAEVRTFQPGDPVRRINWRVSAQRGALHISDRHPELSADVVLLLDTFSDVGDATESTLAVAVRAAAALAAGYLERRDRVGMIGFGGVLTGIGPGLGTAQLERIVGGLLASEVEHSYATRTVATIPPRLLPPRALIVALTPLLDGRTVGALFDLRARGFDLAILELSPERFLPPPEGAERALALRLWRLRRDGLRDRLRSLGVTIVPYDGTMPLRLPVLTAARVRRRPGRAVLR
ncbi:MAG TPA: DUF58 domain-containing protein [Solirubrobacteraceae bacterium]|nr:DUF58 domain-containing protein [Solirubrobacteraceae bacterium]